MALSLAEINRVVLRVVFLPWFRQRCADFDVSLPAEWNPSDEELSRLAQRVAVAFAAPDDEDDEDDEEVP